MFAFNRGIGLGFCIANYKYSRRGPSTLASKQLVVI